MRLGTAPHRLMFFAGACNLVLAMAWWTAWLVHARWPAVLALPYPPVFPGWVHAFVMQYQMLPCFVFGFLSTTFPKWMKLPDLARSQFVPIGLALIAGQLATLVGVLGSPTAIVVGVALTIVGWSLALATLTAMLWREEGTTWHARSCVAGLVLGYFGLIAFGWHVLGGSPTWTAISVKLGTHGFLMAVYFTVAHRMFPFFAASVVVGYQPWRPTWLLAAMWTALALRLGLDLGLAPAWTWIGDGALLALSGVAWWRWWPRGDKPRLLSVLFVGLAWLPVAEALYLADSLTAAVTGHTLLGRAPAHALFVGFFGSVLVAMVTRVTQGHSGRPLAMPPVAWFAFCAIQLVAIVRIVGELVQDSYAWFVVAGVGWLVALAPWVVRLGRTYLMPRVDGKPG
jgi:uncharacterized protein involved in response to NO